MRAETRLEAQSGQETEPGDGHEKTATSPKHIEKSFIEKCLTMNDRGAGQQPQML